MRIGIDVRTILSNRRGFRRLRNLLRALVERPREDDFVFFAPGDLRPSAWPLPTRARWEEPLRRLRLLHRRGVRLIGSRAFRDLDVFHFPTGDVWYSKYAPTVVTLHDLTPLHCADRFFGTQVEMRRYEKHLERIVANADRIVTVSEYSRQDLLNTLGVEPGRVRVIYQGFEDVSGGASAEEQSRSVLSELSIPGPYLFYCGGLDFRKNVEGLLQAFAYYRHRLQGDRLLVIAGEPDPERGRLYPDLRQCAEREKVSECVLFSGWVEDEVLGALYRRADAFVFPSLHEGFGYPPLEAMAAGCFPIVGEIESTREWIQDGLNGLLVDPRDLQQLADAILSALAQPELRRKAAGHNRGIINEQAAQSATRPKIKRFYEQFLG